MFDWILILHCYKPTIKSGIRSHTPFMSNLLNFLSLHQTNFQRYVRLFVENLSSHNILSNKFSVYNEIYLITNKKYDFPILIIEKGEKCYIEFQ